MLQQIKEKLLCKKGSVSVPVLFPLFIILLIPIVGLVIYKTEIYTYTLPLNIIKYILFMIVLIFASISDIKTMEVSDKYTVFLILIGLINVTLDNLIGGLVCFVAFSLVHLITNLGGADVKIAGGCAFILGTKDGLSALLIGLLLSIIIETLINLIKKTSFKRHYPLVPYISTGCIAILVMKGLNIL